MKNIYGKWYPWQELLAYPLMLYYFIKGKRLKELLDRKIENAKYKATKKEFSEKELYENRIEYEKLNNLFSIYFKEVEKSDVHSFDDKIEYCLEKYKLETEKHLSASRVIILQDNFLRGAEKTLYLYFALNKKLSKNTKQGLISLFTKEEYYLHFIRILSENNYLLDKNTLDDKMPKTFIAGILLFLKKQGVIKKVTNVELVKSLKNSLKYEISTSSFSNGFPYPTDETENKLFDELSKVFHITY